MKIVIKPEIEKKIHKAFEELRAAGFTPNTTIQVDNLDVTTFGGKERTMLMPKITFTIYMPDGTFDVEKGE